MIKINNMEKSHKWMLTILIMVFATMHANGATISVADDELCPIVGTLTAYYAREDFKMNDYQEFKKGALVCDSNDPINRIVLMDNERYKYEGDEGGESYSYPIPRYNLDLKTYLMNQLPVSIIGDKKVFISESGLKATIFKSKRNGHKYFSWNPDADTYEDPEAEIMHNECYVLSVEKTDTEGDKYLFEDQLSVTDGYFNLYSMSRFTENTDPEDCRYRPNRIGFIEEKWYNEEAPYGKSHYNENGELQYDQYTTDGSIPEYISICYTAELNALYVDGILYIMQK